LDVDAVEIDPYLREICKYKFSDASIHELYEQKRDIEKTGYRDITLARREELNRLNREIGVINCTALHMVHDDFLTYQTCKHYDLILMNPPFSNGDLHLIKAIEMQKRAGGAIICLLNAETIRNPYSSTRSVLVDYLRQYDAKVEYIERLKWK
jgi:tRNA1(Val) A37 N6-methylase TrmN6